MRLAIVPALLILLVAACNDDPSRESLTTTRTEPVREAVDYDRWFPAGEAFVRRMVRRQGGKRINISCSYLARDELRCTAEWTKNDTSECGAEFTLGVADGRVFLAPNYAVTTCTVEKGFS